MIGVDLIGQIRRAYFEQHRPIKEIVRTLSVSRATVRKVIRSQATAFKYERGIQPVPKLGEWVEVLTEVLEKEAKLPRRERRSTQRLFEELRGRGYDGAHDSVHRFVKTWRNERARVPAQAFVPMSFAPGEAYQFDWSHETITLQGLPQPPPPAHRIARRRPRVPPMHYVDKSIRSAGVAIGREKGVTVGSELTVRTRKLSHQAMRKFFSEIELCFVGMEACASSHYWARELLAMGHDVRLIPPIYVKPYVKRGKNDAADAAAVCEAISRPGMRFVPVKSEESQATLMLHKTRELLIKQQTMSVAGAVLSIAGLWDEWRDPETSESVLSCTVIVTAANDFTRSIHDRMPVLLGRAWLTGKAGVELLRPAPNNLLRMWPVSKRVNFSGRRDDDLRLIEPVDDEAIAEG